MAIVIVVLAGLLPLAPAAFFMVRRQKAGGAKATRRLVWGLSGFNLILALMVVGVGLVWFFNPPEVSAAGLPQQAAADPYKSLAAAVAVSMGSLGAAYAVSATGSAAVGAIAEKPEVFGRALIFVGLAEGVAIYGLIIAFIILQ